MHSPFDDFKGLMPGTARLLDWNASNARARVLVFSSAAVYGDAHQQPITEGAPVRPLSPYGAHKAAAEVIMEAYARIYQFEAVALRIFSVYGPGLARQVVFDMAAKAVRAKRSGQTSLTLHGTGEETRDFIFVNDIAEIALALATRKLACSCLKLNVASGIETRMSELVHSVLRAINVDLMPCFSSQRRPGDPLRYWADVDKLRKLDCLPSTSLADGLAQFASWFSIYSKHHLVEL
jgi:UDP-glucose 4-epimerase